MANQRPLNYGVTFSLMLPESIYDAICDTAAETGRSKGDVARTWLEAGITAVPIPEAAPAPVTATKRPMPRRRR